MEPKKSAEEMELDREEAALRSEAEEISPVRPEDAEIHDDANPADKRAAAREDQDSKKTERTESAKTSDDTGADKPDESKAKSTTAEQKPDAKTAAEKKPADTPDESKLTPFQKERRRLDENWKRMQTEKDEVRKQREELEAQRRAFQEQQQKAQTPKQPTGPTADDYEAIAKDYEAEGKLALAKQAKAKAQELREQAGSQTQTPGGPRERYTPEEVQTMQKQWQTNLEKLGNENPELMQEGTPLRKYVTELLKSTPELHTSGDGIVRAVHIAKLRIKADQADALQAKVAELEKENKRLTGLTALPSGGAQPAGTARKFDDLTMDEQEAALREEAAAV